ncbi:hypothetical protein [Bifidobacterium sp. wkB338]|uniref:hypothetical protein n=1 Tax=Bifidobacterium sp. wkB338 TaxID=2025114 RepID=UPI001604DD32|nr:hypothetical protein [Bifidobacterium sp. wkB338]
MFVGTPAIKHYNTFPDHHPSAFLILDMIFNITHLPEQMHHSRQQNIPSAGSKTWSESLIHKLGTNRHDRPMQESDKPGAHLDPEIIHR